MITFGDNNSTMGSGFIVDNHIVATAAHCVYNIDTLSFIEDISVGFYDENDQRIVKCDAVSIHIPMKYAQGSTDADDYDYALIYVEEDMSQYEKLSSWSLGFMTDEFMSTGSNVVASGFTGEWLEKPYNRYYSRGAIQLLPDNSGNPDLRFYALSEVYDGKSGGPVYYETEYNGNTVKSVVGISSGGGKDGVYGVRITPAVARFYLNNPNI